MLGADVMPVPRQQGAARAALTSPAGDLGVGVFWGTARVSRSGGWQGYRQLLSFALRNAAERCVGVTGGGGGVQGFGALAGDEAEFLGGDGAPSAQDFNCACHTFSQQHGGSGCAGEQGVSASADLLVTTKSRQLTWCAGPEVTRRSGTLEGPDPISCTACLGRTAAPASEYHHFRVSRCDVFPMGRQHERARSAWRAQLFLRHRSMDQ